MGALNFSPKIIRKSPVLHNDKFWNFLVKNTISWAGVCRLTGYVVVAKNPREYVLNAREAMNKSLRQSFQFTQKAEQFCFCIFVCCIGFDGSGSHKLNALIGFKSRIERFEIASADELSDFQNRGFKFRNPSCGMWGTRTLMGRCSRFGIVGVLSSQGPLSSSPRIIRRRPNTEAMMQASMLAGSPVETYTFQS